MKNKYLILKFSFHLDSYNGGNCIIDQLFM